MLRLKVKSKTLPVLPIDTLAPPRGFELANGSLDQYSQNYFTRAKKGIRVVRLSVWLPLDKGKGNNIVRETEPLFNSLLLSATFQ